MNEGLLANWVQLVTACTINAKAKASQQTEAQWGRPTVAVPPPYPLDLLLCQTASTCLKAFYYEWVDFPLNKAYAYASLFFTQLDQGAPSCGWLQQLI